MDRYGASGELLAEQHQTVLGPFLVDSGTDRAVMANTDGTETIYEHGRTYTVPAGKITDDRYKLTRDEWIDCMAERFYDGFYHDSPALFFHGVDMVRSNKCSGDISTEHSLWLSWARGIVSQVIQDVRINSAKVV